MPIVHHADPDAFLDASLPADAPCAVGTSVFLAGDHFPFDFVAPAAP